SGPLGAPQVMWPPVWGASPKGRKDAGSVDSSTIGATEDAAARRVIAFQKPGGHGLRGHYLRGPYSRIEDEVEQVHDEVRDDRTEREHEQQRLRQRVVVAERRLLERVPGTGIAEDELDEDHAADRGRELRGEAVQRRQDRVARRVPRHDAAVAEALGVRHRHVVLADR